MALIKCPECGKDVSTSADACPHCGFPIKKQNNVDEKPIINYPKPKSSIWTEKWKSKAKATRLIWTLIFLLSLVILTISIILLNTDREVSSYDTYTYAKTNWMVFVGIASFIVIIAFAFWIAVLITVKIRARQYDGYIVLVYVGFKHFLVVEDVVQDSGIINRFLYGQLPNKKQVWINISAWDGSVKMGIGQVGDEKNLI